MESILFGTTWADNLNNFIQKNVASHLFLVCNYNPNLFCVIGEDAKFLQGITNLYKFAIDASLINKLQSINRRIGSGARNDNKDFSDLKHYLHIISFLRTYVCHNNDRNEIIDETKRWITEVIHKTNFETIDDYRHGVEELEKIGNKTCDVVEKILISMIKSHTKDRLREEIQAQIVLFYKKNINLVKNELRNAYQSYKNGYTVLDNNKSIALWCKDILVGNKEKMINRLQDVSKQCDSSTKIKLKEEIRKIQSEIEHIKKNIKKQVMDNKSQKNEERDLNSYDYLDFYCKNIVDKIITFLPEIQSKKMTMLPEDIIQYIIEKDFKNDTYP